MSYIKVSSYKVKAWCQNWQAKQRVAQETQLEVEIAELKAGGHAGGEASRGDTARCIRIAHLLQLCMADVAYVYVSADDYDLLHAFVDTKYLRS